MRWLSAVSAAALLACQPLVTPAERVREDLQTLKTEHSVDKLVGRGRAFASVGDLTRAEQYLSAAMEVGGDPAAILPDLLRVCVAADRYRVAIAYASPWLERHPRDRKLRFVVAALRASVGDAIGAGSDLERLVAEAPGDSRAHFAYAVLLRDQLGDPGRADGQFREYLRLEPDGAHADEARAALLETVP
jgi:thioredoxin-like negative regulator of GroEL